MQQIALILFGVGGVGRSLLRQIIQHRKFHANEYNIDLQVKAICDSSGGVFGVGEVMTNSPNGALDDSTLNELIVLKEQKGCLREHPTGQETAGESMILDCLGDRSGIIVDCTATPQTVPTLLLALDRDHRIVLANKIPLTIEQEVYDRLTRAGNTASDQTGVRQLSQSRWETTVGAGLPAIATQNRLVASGDPITKIAGTFSGTLGYVMTGLQEGQKFSEIVRDAHKLGYTEPDPRDDLGGIDVARKALILARGLGWRLEMDDVTVESLYPSQMNRLSVDEFMNASSDLDDDFSQKVESAATKGQVLRYAAHVEDGACNVGPTFVESSSPLGRLSGTDNLVEFHSQWYSPNPLVIQGRGAGVEATAAGVLSDIIELGT